MDPIDDADGDDDGEIQFSYPIANEQVSRCSDDGTSVDETAQQTRTSSKSITTDPVWRRVLPSALDNSLKIWQFPRVQ